MQMDSFDTKISKMKKDIDLSHFMNLEYIEFDKKIDTIVYLISIFCVFIKELANHLM